MAGDGPAYDHAYAEADRLEAARREKRRVLRDKLLQVRHTTGLEVSGDDIVLARMAYTRLAEALQLLDHVVMLDTLLAEKARGGTGGEGK